MTGPVPEVVRPEEDQSRLRPAQLRQNPGKTQWYHLVTVTSRPYVISQKVLRVEHCSLYRIQA